MDEPANTVDQHTQKAGRISLHPLKFEDALKGLLKTKPPEKGEKQQASNASKFPEATKTD